MSTGILHVLFPWLQFVREELKYEDNFDRQVRFHGNDDHITVHDLWKLWVQSEGWYSSVYRSIDKCHKRIQT